MIKCVGVKLLDSNTVLNSFNHTNSHIYHSRFISTCAYWALSHAIFFFPRATLLTIVSNFTAKIRKILHSYSWGAITSSILRIILTTWVASSSWFFLERTDSKMPYSYMLVVPWRLASTPMKGLASRTYSSRNPDTYSIAL